MMETARIRRAGYPIRHSYTEFVQRYRYLTPGIGPAHKVNCVDATRRICEKILITMPDYQLGQTKLFLKDAHDIFLEEERSRIYLHHILILQRGFRRVIFKKWIQKHRNAAIVIQRNWRARGFRRDFLIMKKGFYRLQACIQSRQSAFLFSRIRKCVINIQALCRGFLTRKKLKGRITEKSQRLQELVILRRQEEIEFKRSGNTNWEDDAKINFMARFADLSRQYDTRQPAIIENRHQINIEEDNKVVDDVFGFLSMPEAEMVRPKQVNGIRNMISSFEAQSKVKKIVPSKLLSRPVKVYTYESRY